MGRNRLSVVTGAAGVLGAAVSRRLVAEGHRVLMMDIDADRLDAKARAIGDAASPMVADIGDPAAVERACETIRDEHGSVDTLVNNAGLLSNHKAEDTSPQEWRRLMAVNLDRAFYLARALLPGMRERGFGRVVNVCSLAMKTGGLTAGILVRLARAARANGLELLLELNASAVGPVEEHTTAEIVQRFHDLGVRPDWWKLEPMRNNAAWSRTCGAVARNDPWCRGIVVSGRGECEETVAESLAAAARHASVKGFAAGRTIFAPAARAWLAGGMDDDEAVADMAARYRRLCASWDAARGACTAC